MRMWNVNPKKMCYQHILGEHVEMHMFVGSINKGITLDGYINTGLVEIHNIRKRHDELVEEMLRRGIKHNSPLENFESKKMGKVDVKENEKILAERCPTCKKLIEEFKDDR